MGHRFYNAVGTKVLNRSWTTNLSLHPYSDWVRSCKEGSMAECFMVWWCCCSMVWWCCPFLIVLVVEKLSTTSRGTRCSKNSSPYPRCNHVWWLQTLERKRRLHQEQHRLPLLVAREQLTLERREWLHKTQRSTRVFNCWHEDGCRQVDRLHCLASVTGWLLLSFVSKGIKKSMVLRMCFLFSFGSCCWHAQGLCFIITHRIQLMQTGVGNDMTERMWAFKGICLKTVHQDYVSNW